MYKHFAKEECFVYIEDVQLTKIRSNMSRESISPLPENLAELVVADMKQRAQEAGTNLAELLRGALKTTERRPFRIEDYDADC